MSGLAAIFRRDGRPTVEEDVSAMLSAIPYRGPDGVAVRRLGVTSLGHAKMALTSQDEADRQPLVSSRTGCAIVADVRLDNREEVSLRLRGASSPDWSDAELILRAYEERGHDAFAQLLGDFAFIIWDPRNERLLLARDTSGQRSLFYRTDSRVFAAASEIHQLFQDPAVQVRPNEELVRDFLVPRNALRNEKDGGATFYEGVLSVPAGHFVVVTREGVASRRFWALTPTAELRYRRDTDYVEHYLDLFLDVVRSRLRASVKIGALLSGGLDSSSVVCAAHHLYGTGAAVNSGFVSFTSTFDGLDCDERDLVRDIQMRWGFDARFVPYLEQGGRLETTPRGFQESPNMSARTSRDALLRTVSQSGVRVLLTGDIADACTSGSPLFFDSLIRAGRLGSFWRHLARFRASHYSIRRVLLLYCMAPLLPLRMQRYLDAADIRRTLRLRGDSILPAWMPRELREQLAARQLEFALHDAAARRYSSPARQSEADMLYPTELARHPAPWPIEVWRPFADRRLHEFLLAVPPEQKFRAEASTYYGASKQLTRESMRGLMPESVRTRASKATFSAVLDAEVARQWPDYEATFGPTGRSEIARRGYVDQERFWSRLQALRSGISGSDLVYVMHLIGLETWLRALQLPRPQLVTVAGPADLTRRYEVESAHEQIAMSVA